VAEGRDGRESSGQVRGGRWTRRARRFLTQRSRVRVFQRACKHLCENEMERVCFLCLIVITCGTCAPGIWASGCLAVVVH
jgi:hypothetical protein